MVCHAEASKQEFTRTAVSVYQLKGVLQVPARQNGNILYSDTLFCKRRKISSVMINYMVLFARADQQRLASGRNNMDKSVCHLARYNQDRHERQTQQSASDYAEQSARDRRAAGHSREILVRFIAFVARYSCRQAPRHSRQYDRSYHDDRSESSRPSENIVVRRRACHMRKADQSQDEPDNG